MNFIYFIPEYYLVSLKNFRLIIYFPLTVILLILLKNHKMLLLACADAMARPLHSTCLEACGRVHRLWLTVTNAACYVSVFPTRSH